MTYVIIAFTFFFLIFIVSTDLGGRGDGKNTGGGVGYYSGIGVTSTGETVGVCALYTFV